MSDAMDGILAGRQSARAHPRTLGRVLREAAGRSGRRYDQGGSRQAGATRCAMSRPSSVASLIPTAAPTFLALNTNKRGITLDLEQAAGRSLSASARGRSPMSSSKASQPGHLTTLASDTTRCGSSIRAYPGLHYVFRSERTLRELQRRRPDRAGDGRVSVRRHRTRRTSRRWERRCSRWSSRRVVTVSSPSWRRSCSATETAEGNHIDVSVMEAAIATPSMLIQNYSYLGRNVRGAARGSNSSWTGCICRHATAK